MVGGNHKEHADGRVGDAFGDVSARADDACRARHDGAFGVEVVEVATPDAHDNEHDAADEDAETERCNGQHTARVGHDDGRNVARFAGVCGARHRESKGQEAEGEVGECAAERFGAVHPRLLIGSAHECEREHLEEPQTEKANHGRPQQQPADGSARQLLQSAVVIGVATLTEGDSESDRTHEHVQNSIDRVPGTSKPARDKRVSNLSCLKAKAG